MTRSLFAKRACWFLLAIPFWLVWSGEPERISIHFEAVPLKVAIDSLISKHQIPIVYRGRQLEGHLVSASCEDCSFETSLDSLLRGTPFTWQKVGHQYVIVKHEKPEGAIRGKVFLKEKQQPLGGIEVWLLTQNGTAAATSGKPLLVSTTGGNGRFSFDGLPAGSYTLQLKAHGFADHTETDIHVAGGARSLEIPVEEVTLPLQNIIVNPSYFAMLQDEPGTRQILDRAEIARLPHLADDVYRAVEHLPGIGTGDTNAPIMIRGGANDESLVLLDGLEIDQPFHLKPLLSGVVSIFDSENIGHLELMTGGFPIEYGNKMSGVFNITTDTPREPATSVGINFLNLRLKTEGSFGEGRGTYLVSGRHGFFDIALKFAVDDRVPGDDYNVYYEDFFAKFTYQLAPGQHLALQALTASDHTKIFDPIHPLSRPEEREELLSNNRGNHAWLNLKSFWRAGLFSQTVVSFGNFDGNTTGLDSHGYRRFQVTDQQTFDTVGIRQDWTLERSEKHYLKWGFSFKDADGHWVYRNVKQDLGSFINGNVGSVDADLDLSSRTWGLYAADRFKLTNALTAELGLRYDHQSHTRESQWSPRLHLNYDMTGKRALKFGWGRFYQPQAMHELQIEDGLNQYFPAQLAQHWIAGYEQRFARGLEFRGEVYYKDFSKLRPRFENFLDPLADFPETRGDRIFLAPRRASAKGLELLLMRRGKSRFSWMVNYALSEVNDELDQAEVPRLWDQRHALNLALNYRKDHHWNFNFAWHYHTGWRTTQVDFGVVALANGQMVPRAQLGPLNSVRLPAYHRLDFRASRRFRPVIGRELHFFVEITNLYNRNNIQSIQDHRAFLDNGGNLQVLFDMETWIPFLPSLGLNWVF